MCACSVLHSPKTGEPSDAYLGLLYPTEDFKIYGQVFAHDSKAMAMLPSAKLQYCICATCDACISLGETGPGRALPIRTIWPHAMDNRMNR